MEPDPDATIVLDGVAILRKLARPPGIEHGDTPDRQRIRHAMYANGWLERLVLAMLNLLHVTKDKITDQTSGMRAAIESLLTHNVVTTKMRRMKDRVIPDLLNYVRMEREELSTNDWKREFAAELLLKCMDFKTVREYHTQISQHMEEEFTTRSITEVIVFFMKFFVPGTEEEKALLRNICSDVNKILLFGILPLERFLAIDIYCAIEHRPQIKCLSVEYLPKVDFVIRLLTSKDFPGQTLALENVRGSVRMRALQHLKSLILNNTDFFHNLETRDAFIDCVFMQFQFPDEDVRRAALDLLLDLKIREKGSNNLLLRSALVEMIRRLVKTDETRIYGLELNSDGGRRLLGENEFLSMLDHLLSTKLTFKEIILIAQNKNPDTFNINDYEKMSYGIKNKGYSVPIEQRITNKQLRGIKDRAEMEDLFGGYDMWKFVNWDWETLPDGLNWMCAVWRDVADQRLHKRGILDTFTNENGSSVAASYVAFHILNIILDPYCFDDLPSTLSVREYNFKKALRDKCKDAVIEEHKKTESVRIKKLIEMLAQLLCFTISNTVATIISFPAFTKITLPVLTKLVHSEKFFQPLAVMRISTAIYRALFNLTSNCGEDYEKIKRTWDTNRELAVGDVRENMIPKVVSNIERVRKRRHFPNERFLFLAEILSAVNEQNLFGRSEFLDWLFIIYLVTEEKKLKFPRM